jgi:large repetitive protein
VTVSITVANQAPVAVNDTYDVHGPTTIGPYKANDSDPDSDPITVHQLTLPANGTLQATAQADKYLYTPNSGFVGTDSFTYKVCDNFNTCSAAATVFINVNNISPIANADYFTVRGTTIIGPLFGNDYDPDGDPFTWTQTTVLPSHGSLTSLPFPAYPKDYAQFSPSAGYSGTDSFVYKICDNLGKCSEQTVILYVEGDGTSLDTCRPEEPDWKIVYKFVMVGYDLSSMRGRHTDNWNEISDEQLRRKIEILGVPWRSQNGRSRP